MILRFKENSSAPRYIAFNSVLKTYTTNPQEVKKGDIITVAANHFDKIAAEIDFNGYDYTDNLQEPVEHEEIPLW